MAGRGTGAALAGALALAAPPALVAADCARLAARGWRPGGALDRAALGFAIATALLPLLSLALRPVRNALARHGGRLAALGLGVALALTAAELASRVLIPPTGFHLRPASTSRLNRTDPQLMPGIEGPARHTTNALGIRGTELPGDRGVPRILFLGGSTTECLYLDDGETWPLATGDLIAARLPVWVGAAGRSGRTSVHHLRFLEESPLLASGGVDAVFVLVGLNDLTKALLGVTEADQRAGDLLPLWRRSHLAGLAHGALDRWLTTRSDRLEHWAVHLPRQQAERRAAPKRDPQLDLAPWLDAYARRLERIASLCRERGAHIVFLTQPVQWRQGLPSKVEDRFWFGWLPDGSYATTAALRAGLDAFNARTLAEGERLGVPVVDLAPLSGDLRYFFDDCHFTELGSRAVAELLADWMLAHPEAWGD